MLETLTDFGIYAAMFSWLTLKALGLGLLGLAPIVYLWHRAQRPKCADDDAERFRETL